MPTRPTYQEISCTDAKKIIKACISGKITKIQAGRLRKHLRHCSKCQTYFLRQYSTFVKGELKRWIKGQQIPLLQSRAIVEVEDHPSMMELAAYVEGRLFGAENRVITNHLNGSGRGKAQACLLCRFTVEQLKKM